MLASTFTRSCRNSALRWLESPSNNCFNNCVCCLSTRKLASDQLNTISSYSHFSKNGTATFDYVNETTGQHRKGLKNTSNIKLIKMKKNINLHESSNPDLFGNLTEKNPIWYEDIGEKAIVDNDKSDDSTLVWNISKNYRKPKVYLQRMKALVAEKKLKEALELFVDMKRNFVELIHPHFTFMIGACGKFGFTEMAFKLLRQMTDRGFKPTPATLTGLFNSCGECPFPEYGLKKAIALKEKIKMKNWFINRITYHSMIKAFGKCGDIQTAFQVVDEMAKAEEKIDVATYNFLLMSCISNEAGFTHAIEVWRKMKERRCIPDSFSFNLLLRAARDCDVGPEEVSCLILQHWSSFSTRPYGLKTKENFEKKEYLQIESGKIVDLLSNTAEQNQKNTISLSNSENPNFENVSESIEVTRKEDTAVVNVFRGVLNVLDKRPKVGTEVLDICHIKSASDRLTLIGGVEGILKDMKLAKAKPNIKTFTLLLECLPPSTDAEEHLMTLFEVEKVKPDIGFFNVLIKRRNCRFDYPAAQSVLLLANKWSLTPDVITYGVLAMSCSTHPQAISFLSDMKKLGYSLNTEIIGALFSSACCSLDFNYMHHILHIMKRERLQPNSKMLSRIESTLHDCRKNIIDLEHGKDVPAIFKRKGFARKYKEFSEHYERWLKEIKFDKEDHVWAQYRTDIYDRAPVETCSV